MKCKNCREEIYELYITRMWVHQKNDRCKCDSIIITKAEPLGKLIVEKEFEDDNFMKELRAL